MDQFCLAWFSASVTDVELKYNVPGPWFRARQDCSLSRATLECESCLCMQELCREGTHTCAVKFTFSFIAPDVASNIWLAMVNIACLLQWPCTSHLGWQVKTNSSLNYISLSTHYNIHEDYIVSSCSISAKVVCPFAIQLPLSIHVSEDGR